MISSLSSRARRWHLHQFYIEKNLGWKKNACKTWKGRCRGRISGNLFSTEGRLVDVDSWRRRRRRRGSSFTTRSWRSGLVSEDPVLHDRQDFRVSDVRVKSENHRNHRIVKFVNSLYNNQSSGTTTFSRSCNCQASVDWLPSRCCHTNLTYKISPQSNLFEI